MGLSPRARYSSTGDVDAAFARSVISTTVAGYEALRSDPALWEEELREREQLSGSLGDGLDE
jgi:hypothetical protein